MNSKNAVDSKTVYANYRASMRSLRGSTHKDDWLASNRKQTSLKVTSERYHLPISEVKEIVRTFANKNGVVHEYPIYEVEENSVNLEEEKGAGPIGLQFLRSL